MRNFFKTTLLTALFIFVASSQVDVLAKASPSLDNDTFSKALTQALKHENQGVRMDALRQMALYGENLDLSNAIFEIVRIYRSSEDENTRILALQVLADSKSSWAADFLSRSIKFEKSERVTRHTKAALRMMSNSM